MPNSLLAIPDWLLGAIAGGIGVAVGFIVKEYVASYAKLWHESLRYFRLAQVTDDMFEAYRNLYLALESILDRIAPQAMKAAVGGKPPKPDEGEREWFKRALGEANKTVNLTAFVPQGTTDPVQVLFDELYVNVRTALFHAKTSRHFFLPHDAGGQQAVLCAVERLGSLFVALAAKHLALQVGTGLITYAGFAEMAKAWVKGFSIQVTDDSSLSAADSTLLNQTGATVVPLATRAAPKMDGPHLKSFLGTVEAVDCGGLAQIRCVTATIDGTPVAHDVIKGDLTIGGVARLETHMGIRLRNSRMPKTLFGS